MPGALERFAKLPRLVLLGLGAAVVSLELVGYYFFFYASMAAEKESLDDQHTSLEKEFADYQARRQDYLAFRNELAKLLEEQKELLRILPKDAEIPGFLEQISQQAQVVGVEVQEFVRQPDVPRDFFAQIRVGMRIVGPFHRVAQFFRDVGELQRIVNIENLSLAPGGQAAGEIQLTASFVASTFRFLDQGQATP